jgi:chromosome segregation ATPase
MKYTILYTIAILSLAPQATPLPFIALRKTMMNENRKNAAENRSNELKADLKAVLDLLPKLGATSLESDKAAQKASGLFAQAEQDLADAHAAVTTARTAVTTAQAAVGTTRAAVGTARTTLRFFKEKAHSFQKAADIARKAYDDAKEELADIEEDAKKYNVELPYSPTLADAIGQVTQT